MEVAQLKNFLLEWHARHGQQNKLTNDQCEKVSIKNKTFLLCKAIKSGEYPIIFGYYLDGHKLYCRHFYKSVSEAAWRVGTGLRAAPDAAGSWVKGAEGVDNTDSLLGLKEENLHQPGG